MESFDPQMFKIRDASSYDSVTNQFSYLTERFSYPLVSRMLSLAKVTSNESILDIGTGTGVVALQAAQAIDREGEVWGIDLSEEMIAKAEENARKLRIEQKVKFFRMDAEALGFDDRKFDVVLSLFALLHFPNPLAALKEIYRVIRPGGRLVLAVGSGTPIFSFTGCAHIIKQLPDFLKDFQGKRLTAPHFIESLIKQYIPETDNPDLSVLASNTHHNRSQKVTSLVKQAGFSIIRTDWYGAQEIIDTPEEFWEIQSVFSSIARKRFLTAKAEAITRLYDNFIEKSRKVQSRGGCLVYPFGAFFIVARRL